MKKITLPFLLQCSLFFIPANIVMLGNWSGARIQWPLVLFQQTDQGCSIISVSNMIFYLSSGIITGQSALSLIIWIVGSTILLTCFALAVFSFCRPAQKLQRIIAIGIFLSAILYLMSNVAQYGITLWNNSGFCVPVGIPLFFIVGVFLYYPEYFSTTIQQNSEHEFLCEKNVLSRVILWFNHRSWAMELVLLVFVSVMIKVLTIILTMYSPVFLRHADINVYYGYAAMAVSGKIPYLDFPIEYPQFFIIPIVIVAILPLVFNSPLLFPPVFMIFCTLFDIAILICVYFIAWRLFGRDNAFLPTLLYATAIACGFLTLLTYDIIPTFFLVLSLTLFLTNKEKPACISAGIGSLMKWFPILCLPYFLVYSQKRSGITKELKTGILAAIIMGLLVIIPCIFLNYSFFIQTYTWHLGRLSESHSIIYFLDTIARFFTGLAPFQEYALFVLLFIEVTLLYGYYRYLGKKEVTLCSVIFLSIFFFIIFNKVFTASFILWMTPFLALLLSESRLKILLFYSVQIVMFLEVPLLVGIVYAPNQGYEIFENSLPSIPFLFYALKLSVFISVLLVILYDIIHNTGIENSNTGSKAENQ
jgi:hypothetical protein